MGMVHCLECSEEFELNDVPGPLPKDYFPLCAKHATELHLRPVNGYWMNLNKEMNDDSRTKVSD